jgi:hypothetical protein
MYSAFPAETLVAAWQMLAYLLTAVAVFFGWILVPR